MTDSSNHLWYPIIACTIKLPRQISLSYFFVPSLMISFAIPCLSFGLVTALLASP